jgi:hypothetical protein
MRRLTERRSVTGRIGAFGSALNAVAPASEPRVYRSAITTCESMAILLVVYTGIVTPRALPVKSFLSDR